MPVTSLSDEELLQLCDLQMKPEQSQRLSELLEKQRERQLADDERPELWALMRVYEHALVRKSEALAEAAKHDRVDRIRPTGGRAAHGRGEGDQHLSHYAFLAPDNGGATVEVRLLFRRAHYALMQQKGWNTSDILMEAVTVSVPPAIGR